MEILGSKKLTKKDLLKKLTKKDRRDTRSRIGRERKEKLRRAKRAKISSNKKAAFVGSFPLFFR